MKNEQKYMNFLERFISKHYLKQPPWVRTFTYLIFAMLLVYVIYQSIGGVFSVRGMILQRTEGGLKPAKNYDILVGDKYFGTNSRGFYYLILSSSQYYKLMLSGKLRLGISKNEDFFSPPHLVAFRRFDQEFENIILPLFQEVSQLREHRQFETPLLDPLITSAWAVEPVEEGDRLFVTAVQLKSKLPWIKEGELEFEVNKESLKLLAVQTRGMAAGSIPLVSGETVLLGTDYYFKIPQSLAPSLSGQIKLSTKSKIFLQIFSRDPSETFRVSLNQRYGDIFTVSGDKGSKIDLLLLSPYDVVIWQKQDLEDVEEELKSEFIQKGFRVVKKRSLLGYKAQTNALFGGKSVPFTILQRILKILTDHQIKIKTIQYQLNLKSGNPYEIQVGGSAVFNEKPQIPGDKLDQLKEASTEEEFKRILNQ